jgi:hypothetical protein
MRPSISPGRRLPTPTSASVPTIARTICQQNATARISYRNTPSPSSTHDDSCTVRIVVEPSPPLRQKDAKSWSPTNGSAASHSARMFSGSGIHHVNRSRNGSGVGRFTIV